MSSNFLIMYGNLCSKTLNGLLRRSLATESLHFVPKYVPAIDSDIKQLVEFVNEAKRILVVTGAGISTESGIPDYRSADVGLYARSNHKPVQYVEFLRSVRTRQRYWARNFIGWPRFSQCQPNAVHHALRHMETIERIECVVTQNVDNLHAKAGSEHVIELHGTAYRVTCLQCGGEYARAAIQTLLEQLNPHMCESSTMIRPDGDVEIPQEKIARFIPPTCPRCAGVLKPDIVFFGDNVPKERVERIRKCVSSSDAVLVLGSSLSVFSGYRIILQAAEERKKIAIVNIGPTRADHLAHLKISTRCGDILPKIF